MRFDASRQPELRKEQVEQTEQISDTGTQCHERIHVACTMFQLLPSTDEETSTQYKYHRSGKQPYHIVHPPYMHECHAKHHDRNRQHNRPKSPFLQTLVSGCMSLFCFISDIVFGFDQQIIPCLLHRRFQDKR